MCNYHGKYIMFTTILVVLGGAGGSSGAGGTWILNSEKFYKNIFIKLFCIPNSNCKHTDINQTEIY